jgi:hypothetical protein
MREDEKSEKMSMMKKKEIYSNPASYQLKNSNKTELVEISSVITTNSSYHFINGRKCSFSRNFTNNNTRKKNSISTRLYTP